MVGEAIARIVERGESPAPAAIRKQLAELGPMPSVLGSTGKAEFRNRVLQYDGVLLRMDANLKWQVWTQ